MNDLENKEFSADFDSMNLDEIAINGDIEDWDDIVIKKLIELRTQICISRKEKEKISKDYLENKIIEEYNELSKNNKKDSLIISIVVVAAFCLIMLVGFYIGK